MDPAGNRRRRYPEADGSLRSLSLWQWVVWITCASAGIYILMIGGGYRSIASLEARLVLQAFAVVVLGTWLAVAIIRPAWRPMTPLLEGVLVAALAYSISALFSQRPRLSLEPLLGGLGFALAFLFLARILREPWFRRRIRALVIGGVALVAIAYIGTVALDWVSWWGSLGRVTVPPLRPSWAGLFLGTPNLVAAYLVIAGPLAVTLLYSHSGRRRTTVLLAIAVLLATFLTGARSAYLALGVATVVLVALSLRRGGLAYVQGLITVMRRRPALALVPVAALVLVALFIPAVLHRFAQGGDTVRVDLWRSALDIFGAYPITGGGPGTWAQLKVGASPPGSPNLIFSNAHDIYVQAAAELGLVGLAGLGVLVVAVARRLFSGVDDARRDVRLASVGAISGMAGFATLAVFDSLVNMPIVCLLVAGTVAWVDASLRIPEPAPREGFAAWQRLRRHGLLPGIGLVLVLCAVPTLVRIDSAWVHLLRGNDAAEVGDWRVALVSFDAALELDPDQTLYALQVAAAEARLGNVVRARELLEGAVALDPVGIHQVGLAALELERGDVERALELAQRAVDLAVNESVVALNAGIIGERADDTAFALEQFSKAIAWNPALAANAFWEARERRVVKADVVDAAVAQSEPLFGALVLAYAGRAPEALATLDAQPPSREREIYRAVATWRSGDSGGAMSRLRALLDANPLDWVVAAWMSRIARLSGDFDGALFYGRWALTVQGDSAPSVIFEQSAIPPEFDAATAGLPRAYPTGVYARPTSPYLLMPQLVTIGLR